MACEMQAGWRSTSGKWNELDFESIINWDHGADMILLFGSLLMKVCSVWIPALAWAALGAGSGAQGSPMAQLEVTSATPTCRIVVTEGIW